MTVAAAAVTLWHRAHLYKALACVVLALIAVQYLLSVLDRRSIETIFTINATRYADRSYRTHPRGLIIYGPATAVPNLTGGGNVSSTTILSILAKGLSNSSRFEPMPTRNLVGGGIARELPVANATNNTTMPRCPLIPPNLVGPVVVSKSPPPLSEMERSFVEVKAGGRGRPADCVARHRVAIIIPFRDRPQHLQTLLYNLHPILLRQQIEYQIFVIEQEVSVRNS